MNKVRLFQLCKLFLTRSCVYLPLGGGLGNQLFAMTSGLNIAIRTNSVLLVDTESRFERDKVYKRKYRLDNFGVEQGRYSNEPIFFIKGVLANALYTLYAFAQRLKLHDLLIISFVKPDLTKSVHRFAKRKRNYLLLIDGYWHSEKYFGDNPDIIAETYSNAVSKYIESNASARTFAHKVQQYGTKAVALHVRDFGNKYSFNLLDTDYYEKSIITLLEVNKYIEHVIVFSNLSKSQMQSTNLGERILTCSQRKLRIDTASFQDEIIDLGLMSYFSNLIIANSTFSWWSAWLAEHRYQFRTNIIAPGIRINDSLSSWGEQGLMPDRWIKVS
jgi:hypothetical protein